MDYTGSIQTKIEFTFITFNAHLQYQALSKHVKSVFKRWIMWTDIHLCTSYKRCL